MGREFSLEGMLEGFTPDQANQHQAWAAHMKSDLRP